MLPYWLTFAFWSFSALQAERRRSGDAQLPLFIAAAAIMVVLIGLRFEVGADWGNYLEIYKNISLLSLGDAMVASDPAYGLLNWLGAAWGYGIALPNLVCAILFFIGFARLAWRQPNPALAVLIAIPYLIIVVAMGYTRQAAAIGLICLAVADASERRLVRVVFLLGAAALFHKTAILMLPIILVPIFIRNVLLGAVGALVFVVLFALILRGSAHSMINQYVTSEYDSQGAAVRISMNVLAAVVFLTFRKAMDFPPFQKTYWTSNAVLALLSVPALVAASASAGVDRFSLYLIPLQVVTYARLPYVVGRTGKAVPSVLFGVIIYSFCVQFVWLTFADNAQAWLPYRSMLW